MAKILIVDDEQQIVSSVSELLRSFGFETISATDAKDGYKKAMEQHPDLIVLDWMMPEFNGLDFTKQYRSKGYNIVFNIKCRRYKILTCISHTFIIRR